MNPATIESVRIKGFRSLADVELSDLPRAAVLIGANGSGKSNFIRFFEMLSWMLRYRRLGEFIEKQGGADDQLHGGNRVTPRMEAEIELRTPHGRNDYRFALSHAHPDRFFFSEEAFRSNSGRFSTRPAWQYLGNEHREAAIVTEARLGGHRYRINRRTASRYRVNRRTASRYRARRTASVIVNLLSNCSVYQFHDTSDTSDFKIRWDAADNNRLRSHGGNLAAVLYRLEREDIKRFNLICRHIGRVLPGFDRFDIQESYGKVLLRWRAKWSDKTFGAHLTSDGSLRFFALVTLLNLPSEMLPDVLLLDEPELGLHPSAVSLVGGMIRSLSVDRQVIVATQSPLLVDTFGLDEIFVMDLKDGRTQIRKLNAPDYAVWLEDGYSTGQLWWKNLLGGRP